MKKKIAWLFLVAIALVAVPVSHASGVTRSVITMPAPVMKGKSNPWIK